MSQQDPLLGETKKQEKDTDLIEIPHNKVYRLKGKQIFIPAYVALVVKNLRDIDLKAGKITMLATFIIRIPSKDVPEEVIEDIMERGLEVRLNEEKYGFSKEDSNVKRDKFISFT
jgi:hypothetical protein